MSKNRCCCNCRHNIRYAKDSNPLFIESHCEMDNHYISYVETFDGWCRHWAKDHKFDEVKHGD